MACTGQRKDAYRFRVGKSKGKRSFRRSSVDGKIILKLIFKVWDGRAWTGLIWFRIGRDDWLLRMRE